MNNALRPTRTPVTWNRGLYMLLLAIFYSIAEFVLVFIVSTSLSLDWSPASSTVVYSFSARVFVPILARF